MRRWPLFCWHWKRIGGDRWSFVAEKCRWASTFTTNYLTKYSGQSSCGTALQVTHENGVRCMPCTAEESGKLWELLVATNDGRQCLEFIKVR